VSGSTPVSEAGLTGRLVAALLRVALRRWPGELRGDVARNVAINLGVAEDVALGLVDKIIIVLTS
jgi:hypothetical protein